MPLKPRFLHTDISELRISRQRLVGGAVIGLLYAFALYGLLYMSREVMRMMSVTRNHDLWVMSDAEVNFYNLVFAFIAVIFGFSTGFLFCVERPRKAFGQLRYQRFSIINDQRALNWYFLSAYSKLAWGLGTVYAAFYCYRNFFYPYDNPYENFLQDDNLFPSYKLIYILIVIVLFLQMWTTIRQVFKNKSLKWMLVSMLGLVIAGLGLSRVNLVDYNAVNESILKNNVHYTYKIELPNVTYHRSDYFRKGGRINDIYFVQNSNERDGAPMMLFEGREMSFKEISDEKKARSEYWWHQEELRLHFHRTIKMKHVWKVFKEMGKEGVYKFSFAVVKIRHENDKRYYHDYSLPAQIPIQHRDSFIRSLIEESYEEEMENMDDIIEVRHSKSGYFLDGILLEDERFKQTIRERIEKSSPKYVIKFHVKDDANIESYVQTLSLLREIHQGIMDGHALLKYEQKEKSLDYEQRKEIRKKYPLAVFQITEEMEAKYE